MTAPECRPPDGTPDGAVCLITRNEPPNRWWYLAIWGDGTFYLADGLKLNLEQAFACGYRFHSLATPPEPPK